MLEPMQHSMDCPVCLETMTSPILQCERGHSTCGDCGNNLESCPLCRGKMTGARNYQLEDLIASLRGVTLTVACDFAKDGCKYVLKPDEKASHQLGCKNRNFICVGNKFGSWKCEWTGKYDQIVQHFKTAHNRSMEFKTEGNIKIDLEKDSTDVHVIDYQNGQQIFWYKYKLDTKQEKGYWLFQYVGLRKQAAQYYYEFEVYNGPTRKLKITEICESDCKDTDVICNEGKCVELSFKTIKNFLNEKGELAFRFRIMKIRYETPTSSNPVVPKVKNSNPSPPRIINSIDIFAPRVISSPNPTPILANFHYGRPGYPISSNYLPQNMNQNIIRRNTPPPVPPTPLLSGQPLHTNFYPTRASKVPQNKNKNKKK